MRTAFFPLKIIVFLVLIGVAQSANAQQVLWETYRDAGLQQYQAGHYPEAEKLLRSALQAAEQLNPGGRRVAKTLNDLGLLYEAQGKYAEAEPLYTRSLAIMQSIRGADDFETATVMSNLANFYSRFGKN